LFKATKITRQTLAKNLTKLFDQYRLRKTSIAYVKDEDWNLNIMMTTLIYYEMWSFGLNERFQSDLFGHVFSKACQYVITNETFYRNLKFISIKSAQSDLQKCITWHKNFGNNKQGWNKACLDFNLSLRKLNSPMKTWSLFNLLQFFSLQVFFHKFFFWFVSYWIVLVKHLSIACLNLIAHFVSKIVMFQKALQFKNVILYYNK